MPTLGIGLHYHQYNNNVTPVNILDSLSASKRQRKVRMSY